MGSATKTYVIGKHAITLPRGHQLPKFQAVHNLYDRFLPFLCREVDGLDEWVIDVGANVGDTAIAMLQACRNPMLCIEAEPGFYGFLVQNVASLAGASSRTICVNTLVGTGQFSGPLDVTHMTSRLREGASNGAARPLDAIVAEAGASRVALVKVDTDGYDSDVIMSGTRLLTTSQPILFWENYATTPEETDRLSAFYAQLEERGYKHAWIFDNYGNLIVAACDLKHVEDVNRYVASQNFNGCSRTMEYTDIVASTDRRSSAVTRAVEAYRKELVHIARPTQHGLRYLSRRLRAWLR